MILWDSSQAISSNYLRSSAVFAGISSKTTLWNTAAVPFNVSLVTCRKKIYLTLPNDYSIISFSYVFRNYSLKCFCNSVGKFIVNFSGNVFVIFFGNSFGNLFDKSFGITFRNSFEDWSGDHLKISLKTYSLIFIISPANRLGWKLFLKYPSAILLGFPLVIFVTISSAISLECLHLFLCENFWKFHYLYFRQIICAQPLFDEIRLGFISAILLQKYWKLFKYGIPFYWISLKKQTEFRNKFTEELLEKISTIVREIRMNWRWIFKKKTVKKISKGTIEKTNCQSNCRRDSSRCKQ